MRHVLGDVGLIVACAAVRAASNGVEASGGEGRGGIVVDRRLVRAAVERERAPPVVNIGGAHECGRARVGAAAMLEDAGARLVLGRVRLEVESADLEGEG